jgi:hypothetical protein
VDTIGINPNLCARDRSNMTRWNVGNVFRENVTATQPIVVRLFFLTDGRNFFVYRHSDDPKQIALHKRNEFTNNGLIQGLFQVEQAFTISIVFNEPKA